MELFVHSDSYFEGTYYVGEHGRRIFHGYFCAQVGNYMGESAYERRGFYWHDRLHGEFMQKNTKTGNFIHLFYIDGNKKPSVDMSPQEKLLFQIQHPNFRFLSDNDIRWGLSR